MPLRQFTSGSGYRYGFNGKEEDDEVKGNGNQQDYGMRIYDPRLGRFLSVDPLTPGYAELTPYQFASNTPIEAIDLDGLEAKSSKEGFWQGLGNAILEGAVDLAKQAINNPNHAGYGGGVTPSTGKPPTISEFQPYKTDWSYVLDPTRQIMNFSENVVYGVSNFYNGVKNKDGRQFGKSLNQLSSAISVIYAARLFTASFKPKITIASKEAFEYMYRVQGGGSKIRFILDQSNKNLSISGDDMLFVNIGQEGRAIEFLAKRGDDAVILKIKINKSFTDKLRKEAVPQNVGRLNPGKPQSVDPSKAPDQFGVPKEYFNELLQNIDQNSVEIITKPKG